MNSQNMPNRAVPWRVYCEGRICVRRIERFVPIVQDGPCQKAKLEASLAGKGNGQTMCAITDEPVED